MVNRGQPASLVRQLRQKLFLTVGLLIMALALTLFIGSFIIQNNRNWEQQRSQISDNANGLLRASVEQESNLRDYINTAEAVFLDAFNKNSRDFAQYLQNINNQTHNDTFNNTATVVPVVQDRADDWYTNYARIQIQRMAGTQNDIQIARNDISGKPRFDRLREAETQLQNAVQRDLDQLQAQANLLNWLIVAAIVVIALAAVFTVWQNIDRFATRLRTQLNQLEATTGRLASGDLTARVREPGNDELGRLATDFNNMADALQQQQSILKERDILESVLQLNNTLSNSLELELLADEFLGKLLQLLQLQIAALYLYDQNSNQLVLTAACGQDKSELQAAFTLGSGLVGQTAVSRKPLFLAKPDETQAEHFEVKTLMGRVLPTMLYHLPLTRGEELLGVLVTGSVYGMGEKARNVLNVVAANFSAAVSHALAYRHIQQQAEELEQRRFELEETNRKLSHQRDELKVLNSALEETSRLRNQFLSTISHELRTPLTAIIGFSQLSLRQGEVAKISPRLKTNLDRILKNGQHLLSLVNNVLDLAKIDAQRVEVNYRVVNLREFLMSIIEEVQSIANQKRLKLECWVDDSNLQIETDVEKLRQIMLNLVSNALKFTDQGEVRINARMLPPDAARFVGGQFDLIAIEVKDTGIGIDPKMQERIFDEYYQVDNSTTRPYGGTGLGLSIASKLMNLLGGRIDVDSVPGDGSTFTVVLPAQAPVVRSKPPEVPEQRAIEPDGIEPPPATNGKKERSLKGLTYRLFSIPPTGQRKKLILAIDDDQEVLSMINMALEDTPYQVIGLLDPTKALEAAAQLKPYAVTLDVMMPESSGWQILQQLKGSPSTASTPVVMLTVLSEISASRLLGADDYLTKPVDRDILLSTLDRLSQQPQPAC